MLTFPFFRPIVRHHSSEGKNIIYLIFELIFLFESVTTAAGLICWKRNNQDIGVRDPHKSLLQINWQLFVVFCLSNGGKESLF